MLMKRLYLVGMVLTILGLTTQAYASSITFDSAITPGANALYIPDPFVDTYIGPDQGTCPPSCAGIPSPVTFTTDGFTFGGFTLPVTTFRTKVELNIMNDASLCATTVGAVCASDGSHYLIGGDPFSIFLSSGVTNFGFFGFDATALFDAKGCPGCSDEGTLFGASFLRVIGVRNGVPGLVADETFALTPGFQSFAVTDPDWGNVSKIVIRPVDANGDLIDRVFAMDNLQLSSSPVPEPASLLLLGTGLAGLVVRRRLKARR